MSADEDRISNLPKDLIASILGKIPIRDAVRTSVLAKKWRFYYLCVRELVFDDKFWKDLGGFVLKKSSNIHNWFNQFDEIITKSLLLHPGGLEKFKVYVPNNGSNEPPLYVNKWILYLSSKNIKTLILIYDKVIITQSYKLPTYFFSCLDLTFLKLHNVALSPPLGFKGFHKMCRLKLYGIDFKNDCFESFISSCPLLTSLVLDRCSGIRHFNIRCSKLKRLFIKANAQFESISLNSNPNLVEVSVALGFTIGLEGNSVFNLDKFVSTLPKVKILRLNGKFLQFFTEKLSMSVHRTSLKILEFKDVNFMDIDQISGIVRLLRCAPNLQELYIEACTIILNQEQVSNYLRKLYGRNFTKLRLVKMMKIASFVPEFEFIQFLLLNSPSLVTMSIVEHPHLEAEKALDIARKLLQLMPPSKVCIDFIRDGKRRRS